MESLKRNVDELNESLESAVRLSELQTRQNLDDMLAEHAAALDAKEVVIADLQQKLMHMSQEHDVQRIHSSAVKRIPATEGGDSHIITATPSRVTQRPVSTPSTAARKAPAVDFMSPSQLRSSVKFRAVATPGSIAKRYLEGTPGARPVQWVVEQANTEVKRLRERAEQIARGDAGAAATITAVTSMGAHGGEGEAHSHAGTHAMWRMKINAMKLHLSEALAVIQEQDRLIHSGKHTHLFCTSDKYARSYLMGCNVFALL